MSMLAGMIITFIHPIEPWRYPPRLGVQLSYRAASRRHTYVMCMSNRCLVILFCLDRDLLCSANIAQHQDVREQVGSLTHVREQIGACVDGAEQMRKSELPKVRSIKELMNLYELQDSMKMPDFTELGWCGAKNNPNYNGAVRCCSQKKQPENSRT